MEMDKKYGKLNEREQDEAEALSHYIKYLNTNPNVKDWELWDGLQRLDNMGSIFLEKNISEKEMEVLGLDDMKELIDKFFHRLMKLMEEKELNNE